MDPELRQQLRVDDPMEEPELNLDGLPISSIQVLLEPPSEAPLEGGDDEDDDGFYSPLDHFRNLVKLSMSSSQCSSLEGFPPLPLLRSLLLADNNLSDGFEALAEADLQNLVLLDLTANNIKEASALAPLDALENLQHLMLEGNPVAGLEGYRDSIFEVLPQLISLDSMDRDGTVLDVDQDALSSADEHYPEANDEEGYDNAEGELEDEDEDIDESSQPSHHYQERGENESEDVGTHDEEDEEEYDEEEESDAESGSERPMTGGKTSGGYDHGDEDEDVEEEDEEDEDEEEEEYDEGDAAQYQHTAPSPQQLLQQHQQQQSQYNASGSEDEEEDDEEEEDEEDNEEEEEEEDEEEAPGLAYLLADDIQDDNDEEFEPQPEPEEESEMESSDEDEYGSSKPSVSTITAAPVMSSHNNHSNSQTNGHSTTKRPRSPEADDSLTGGFEVVVGVDSVGGFDVDGDDANGFGMAPFDGPATFDEDSTHDSKRPRT
ncbi:hypothetical protein FBU30_008564 [Linnemannia zychae]|nr:hypothetical protein FBU30_008564 [Linnemannia zychae]